VALAVRALALAASHRFVVDIVRYHRVASHVLDVSWNPYLAPRLFPYPPVWVWAEAAAEWMARRTALPFPVLVKLPVMAADLALVLLLARWGRARGGRARRAGWIYALHPVVVLVGGFHGQFESLALLCVVLALLALERGRLDASALALAAGIAVKSFPVLLLPVLLPAVPPGRRVRYAALATLPVALILLPFAIDAPSALARELFAYGGVADFGWIGAWRGLVWWTTGVLVRSEPRHWGDAVPATKLVFLAVEAALVLAIARRRLAWTPLESALAVFLAFQAFYGALSAQYLAWVLPLGALRPDRPFAVHGAFATVALAGFYLFLAPGVLLAPEQTLVPRVWAGGLWVLGTSATLLVAFAWLAALVFEARRPA
jgi:hypothetical protein